MRMCDIYHLEMEDFPKKNGWVTMIRSHFVFAMSWWGNPRSVGVTSSTSVLPKSLRPWQQTPKEMNLEWASLVLALKMIRWTPTLAMKTIKS